MPDPIPNPIAEVIPIVEKAVDKAVSVAAEVIAPTAVAPEAVPDPIVLKDSVNWGMVIGAVLIAGVIAYIILRPKNAAIETLGDPVTPPVVK